MTKKDNVIEEPSTGRSLAWTDSAAGEGLDLQDLLTSRPGQDGDSETDHDDPIFRSIQDQISAANSFRGSTSTLVSEAGEEDGLVKYSDSFTQVPYGFQPRKAYSHPSGCTDIMGLSYNGRMRQFIILDSKGVTLWNKDALTEKDAREQPLQYPRYEYRLITNIVYARKYNVYFALGKDFALKVLNREFQEICHVRSDLQSILFMIFNPVRDELITGGVAGAKIWSYKQAADDMWTEIKHMANYKLVLKQELKNVGGAWVKRVDLDLKQQQLYCCSDMDLYAYDMEGKLIFKFERAHSMSITGCVYSAPAKQFLTVSADSEMKVWSPTGGLVHTFRGHARAISNVLLHPDNGMLVLTASLDGSVRLWSLDTMECLYSLVVSTDGVLWMGLTDDGLLYLSTMRAITLWSFNNTHQLWALARNQLLQLQLVPGEGKSTRVLAVGEDSSVKIFSRKSHKNLSTVLPPPISSMQRAKCFVYNRVYSVVYMLISSKQIWVYTTRTDPACRIAVWDVFSIQQEIALGVTGDGDPFVPPPGKNKATHATQHRATLHGTGKDGMAECLSLCYLNSPAVVWTEEEGLCCPMQHVYLLFGLSDGRILFMDPVVRAKKYFEFRANKDSVIDMRHDAVNNCLMTVCDLLEAYHIQVWSLPQLVLLHEVFTAPDVSGYIRLNSTLVTAHRSGAVTCHELQHIEDTGFSTYRPKFDLEDETSSAVSFDLTKVDHSGPVLSIDACHKLEIFATCSPDGVIKVWQENKVLLTEIQLAETLNSVCFLNDCGDLLCGFKQHIFFIHANRVCPSIEKPGWREEEEEVESDVYEDPAVVYEGVVENPDPIDLDNYLVPFDIDFSKDFIEGKKALIPPKDEAQDNEEDVGSELSWAPTDIYRSPCDTPRRLSLLDLTLTREPSKYDLRKSMTDMLMNQQRKSPGPANSRVTFTDGQTGDDEDDEEMRGFELPQFGVSPGPTPSPSTPSAHTPSDFDVSEGGESTEVEDELGDMERSDAATQFTPIHPAKPGAPTSTDIMTPKAVKDAPPTFTTRTSKLGAIRLDSRSLMQKEVRGNGKGGAESALELDDHGHKQLVKDLQAQKKKEASRKRDEIKEKKAAKAAEKRKKKLEKLEKKASAMQDPETAVDESKTRSRVEEPRTVHDQSLLEKVGQEESKDSKQKPAKKKRKERSILVDSSDEEGDTAAKPARSGQKSKTDGKAAAADAAKRQIKVPDLPSVQPRLGASPSPRPAEVRSKTGDTHARSSLIGDIQIPGAGGDTDQFAEREFDQMSEILDDLESQESSVTKTRGSRHTTDSASIHSQSLRQSPSVIDTISKQSDISRASPPVFDSESIHSRSKSGHSTQSRPKSGESTLSRPKSGVSSGALSFNSDGSRLDDKSSLSKLSLPTVGYDYPASDQRQNLAPPSGYQSRPVSDWSRQQSGQDSDWSALQGDDGGFEIEAGALKLDLGGDTSARGTESKLDYTDNAALGTTSQNLPKLDTFILKHDKEETAIDGGSDVANDLQKVKDTSDTLEASETLTEAGKTTPSAVFSGIKDIDSHVDKKTIASDLSHLADDKNSRVITPLPEVSVAETDAINSDTSGKQTNKSKPQEGSLISKDALSEKDVNRQDPDAKSSSTKISPKPPTETVEGIVGNWLSAMPGSNTMSSGEKSETKSILRGAASQGGRSSSTRPLSGVKVGFKEGHKGQGDSDHVTGPHGLETSASGLGTLSPDPGHVSTPGLGGYTRSVSPTIYSDYGSDWTMPAPDDASQSRLADFSGNEPSDYLRRMRAELLGGPLHSVSYAARPNTPADGAVPQRVRPYTAIEFTNKTEELEFMFAEALRNYKGIPGTEEYIKHLHENAGTKFGEHYHDRVIERHQLLRMQRSLRAQSARDRRHLLQLRQRDVSKTLLGHQKCDQPRLHHEKSPDHTQQILNEMLAACQPPSSPTRPTTAVKTPGGHPSIPNIRAKSAGPMKAKEQIASRATRPKTAPVSRGQKPPSSPEDRKQLSEQRPFRHTISRPQSAVAPDNRSVTSAATQRHGNRQSKRTSMVSIQDRLKIKQERRMFAEGLPKSGYSEDDVKMMDPRNPVSRYLRGHTKSIPSKCSQYMLVSRRRGADVISATPVEENLILDRFPEWQEKWLGPHLRHQRPTLAQKVSYSPQPLR